MARLLMREQNGGKRYVVGLRVAADNTFMLTLDSPTPKRVTRRAEDALNSCRPEYFTTGFLHAPFSIL